MSTTVIRRQFWFGVFLTSDIGFYFFKPRREKLNSLTAVQSVSAC